MQKKGNIHNKIFLLISIVLVLLSFLPVVGLNADLELQKINLNYNGFDIMFGKTINELSGYISVNGNLEVKIKDKLERYTKLAQKSLKSIEKVNVFM